MTPGNTRESDRRAKDAQTVTLLDRLAKVLDRWKMIILALGVLGAGAASLGAYLGAYVAMPQRVTRLENKVDSAFRDIGEDVDSLRANMATQDTARGAIDEKLELLLRINCPSVQRADLVRPCRPYIASPPPRAR